MWDEAAVACQFHELNVEGSNPSPTIISGYSVSGNIFILGINECRFKSYYPDKIIDKF
jgi:hypothetical protein